MLNKENTINSDTNSNKNSFSNIIGYNNGNKDVLDIVEELVEQYNLYVINSNTNDVHLLLDLLDKFAILSYYIADKLVDKKTSYNYSFLKRKLELNRVKQRIINDRNISVNKADIEANIEVEYLYREEIANEAEAYKYENILNQVNLIMSALKTRINYLYLEYSNTCSNKK